jgi:hypothetical protein
MAHAPVTIVIPTKDPPTGGFTRCLDAIANLDPLPAELIIVDATDGGFPEHFSPHLGTLRSEGISVDVLEADVSGISRQRHKGVHRAEQPYVWTFDDTTVPLTTDWMAVAIDRIETDDGVVAVGGTPEGSLGGGVLADMVASASNAIGVPHGGWQLTFPTHLCVNDMCFPPTMNRNDDSTVRQTLSPHGRIVRDERLRFLDDFPTTRQRKLLAVGGAAAGVGSLVYWG